MSEEQCSRDMWAAQSPQYLVFLPANKPVVKYTSTNICTVIPVRSYISLTDTKCMTQSGHVNLRR